ncbi:MAG: hypothetical protein QE285_16650 [Aquabacterium sp.]|nr:hypothetical protein [Aquabacterium sp.]
MHRFPDHGLGIARLTLCLALCLPAVTCAAEPARQAALLAEHAALHGRLADSPFGEPLLLHTTEAGEGVHNGDVLAVLPQPLGRVAAVLRTAASLCGMLVLHLNVRDCQPVAGAPGQQLLVTAGPMRAALPGLTDAVPLLLQPQTDTAGHFSMLLTAPSGQPGNNDLRVHLEAVALAPDQTYLHITYHQASGLARRMATRLYLATAGRDKVGFSRSPPGPDGQMRRVTGERAALERNVMRHYLALLASTAPVDGPPAAQRDARLRAWFALTERHATQLHELNLADYLAEKAGVAAGPR